MEMREKFRKRLQAKPRALGLLDALFANQKDLGPALYERLARELGLNVGAFSASMAGHTNLAGIQADLAEARKLALRGTPTFMLNGKPLPGVAQVAMQQGRYAGRLIHQRVVGEPPLPPFRYFDKGTMAVVGKGFAVLQSGRVHIRGFLAWLAWAAVHLEFLGQSSLRVSVFVQWVWLYVTGQRGSRLIVNHHASTNDDARTASPPERQPVGTR